MTQQTETIAQLRPQWAEAERKMYPLATTSPEKYEHLIKVARHVANDLTKATTSVQLATMWGNCESLIEAACARMGVGLGGLPVREVAGVAFSLRYGEIQHSEYEQQMTALIDATRVADESWVLLHEQGDIASGLMDAYQSIELHRPTGAAIVASIEPDPVTGRVTHVLTVVRLDPITGMLADADPGFADTRELDDVDDFLSSRAELRRMIEHTEVR